MRVGIIGAGAAGLATARHVSTTGCEIDVFEMAPQLGGTWVYTDEVGKDRYGYPVYSAMYKGLRTNLPKEVMGFPDFPIPEQDRSYLTQAEILQFLNMYAKKFDLEQYIKFNTMVQEIRPYGNDKWQITSVYKPSGKVSVNIYDSVIICNGHYNDPIIPKLPGQELFKGKIDHSHNYRDPEKFKGQRVLVIGAGPSGLDLTLHLSGVAEHVVLSHHVAEPIKTQYPSNVELRPDVKRILDFKKVEFTDGSCCCFDSILFCTGYRYSFPFLDKSCGITMDDNHIQPLYKHMIHIDKPSMCFIGIPFNVCTFQMFDLQARYYCRYLKGEMSLPSKEAMNEDTQADIQARLSKGYNKRQMHMMGPDQESYYNQLAEEANTSPIPPVMVKLRDLSVKRLYDDLLNFRDDQYRIVDEQNFVKVTG
ncbi:senecionine N-oxygenase [Anthonomus grandis grandis]|uniref:senecionine N-oxygenase n=1 Tax=Anthonomus grandis grandis TaxID=2921223 RepID=UPI002165B964|nr:senecionine N-oxygenase [Anthonomus grandis grandis]